MDQLVEEVNSCIKCQATVVDNRKEPFKSELPRAPWVEVSVGFAELEGGDYLLLVVIGDYS
jgi:hypothetical protein